MFNVNIHDFNYSLQKLIFNPQLSHSGIMVTLIRLTIQSIREVVIHRQK